MKTLIMVGGRSSKGRTAQAAQSLAEGLESRGVETKTVYLPEMSIERCRQCDDDGWGLCRDDDRCVVEDDLPGLLSEMREADALAFVTPVYFSDLSESMLALLDRLRRISRNDQGGLRGKPAIGICLAGGGGGGAPACAANLQKILGGCGLDVLDIVPCRRQNLDLKKRVLRLTGEWMADRLQGD
jgi:multimeric flavodoxin WrbA